MKNIHYLIMLALTCFILSTGVKANENAFDIRLSEFVLKNATPLISQIKRQEGLGYESIRSQILAWDCSPEVLSSPYISQATTAYDFHSRLIDAISQCSSQIENNELSSILEGKIPYLIISGESLNSPMSYFGHSSLLFLDPKNFYFSPVVSIIAPTEDLSELEQLVKGGFSNIKAEVKVLPLHQIIDSYNNKESRELRFIKLDANIFNAAVLIDYLTGIQSQDLKYNFFLQNCSTYIFEALQHSCNCLTSSPKVISPLFLEKSVIEDSKAEEFSLASLYRKFNANYENLTASEKQKIKQMFLKPESETYPEENKQLGYTSVLASRLSFEGYRRPYPSYEKILNTYGNDSALLSTIPDHINSSIQKRDSLLFTSVKSSFHKDGGAIGISAVDFDHFEQRSLNFKSAKLKVVSVVLDNNQSQTKVKSFDLLNIQSVTPLNFVTHTPSWKFRLGAERNDQDDLNGLLEMGVGAAFKSSSFTFYSIPSIKISDDLSFPIYSGIHFKSEVASVKYEMKNLSDSTLSFFRRENSAFGYGYNLQKEKGQDYKHEIAFSFFF